MPLHFDRVTDAEAERLLEYAHRQDPTSARKRGTNNIPYVYGDAVTAFYIPPRGALDIGVVCIAGYNGVDPLRFAHPQLMHRLRKDGLRKDSVVTTRSAA